MESRPFDSNPRPSRPRKFSGHLHRIVFWVLIGVLMACGFALVFGFAVKLLWSVTLAPIFSVPEISYWQAVGIVILARLIFGGFGHRDHRKDPLSHSKAHPFSDHQHFFDKMHDRFHGMPHTEEDDIPAFVMSEADKKHYQAYWEKEGKQAFDDYMSRIEQDRTD